MCNDSIVINSKIDKNIIIDIEDKATAKSKPYTKEKIIEYEVMTRDNRINTPVRITRDGNKKTWWTHDKEVYITRLGIVGNDD